MKAFSIIVLICLIFSTDLFAQEIDILGKVVSGDDQMSLPGVSILIKGTSSGTITDADGNFSIPVRKGNVLQFSYVGYETAEVEINNQSEINISLNVDVEQLQEVIVTSLGIQRQTKALGYSITEVEGDKFTEARENNLANALTGRDISHRPTCVWA